MSGTFLEAIIICGNSSDTVLVKHTNEMVPQWYGPFAQPLCLQAFGIAFYLFLIFHG